MIRPISAFSNVARKTSVKRVVREGSNLPKELQSPIQCELSDGQKKLVATATSTGVFTTSLSSVLEWQSAR